MTTTFRPAGYLVQRHPGQPPEGDPGTGYDYVMAGNGLLISAENDLLAMTLPLAEATVRGLPTVEPALTLTHGPLPKTLLNRILSEMKRAAPYELFAAITWEPAHGYRAIIPPQQATRAHVSYDPLPHTVLQIHSHGDMDAFFSAQDNSDEQGLAIYAVAGHIGSNIRLSLRAGAYGHFSPLRANQVFTPA